MGILDDYNDYQQKNGTETLHRLFVLSSKNLERIFKNFRFFQIWISFWDKFQLA